MRLLDILTNTRREQKDLSQLWQLQDRLGRFTGSLPGLREALLTRVLTQALPFPAEPQSPLVSAVVQLLEDILASEGLLVGSAVSMYRPLSTAEVWEVIKQTTRRLSVLEEPRLQEQLAETLIRLVASIVPERLPPQGEAGAPEFFAPLYALLPNPSVAIESAVGAFLGEPRDRTLFPQLWQQLEWNLLTASGINPEKQSSKTILPPTKAKDKAPGALIPDYLGQTPLQAYFTTPVPFAIPLSSRFEHMHVMGGSGHGKTQLLQSLILRDLEQLAAGNGSIVVIDSQGDMIRTILGLSEVSALSERLVLIDPNDIEYPPCLNLFDFGLDRLTRYTPIDREKLVNGAIALYEYMFGALLGADLTQRQGVIFRYLARLLMVVPGATIHTLREFMENPESTRRHLGKLDPTSKIFFETQFFSKVYDDTRQQILTRLWGVISNGVLARMFSNRENKVDMFSALNTGSLILVNTAKDLLKQDGCEILGRFFIALLVQAIQERAAIPEDRRRATFVYIDEAQDYFDEGIENLLNQARKYRAGLILAHQHLGQFDTRLQGAVMASTAMKLVGGVSAKDALPLSREMRCEADFLLGMRKHPKHTEFACFVRNLTPQPIALSVPFGQMEARPRMTEDEAQALLVRNRQHYCSAQRRDAEMPPATLLTARPETVDLSGPELL